MTCFREVVFASAFQPGPTHVVLQPGTKAAGLLAVKTSSMAPFVFLTCFGIQCPYGVLLDGAIAGGTFTALVADLRVSLGECELRGARDIGPRDPAQRFQQPGVGLSAGNLAIQTGLLHRDDARALFRDGYTEAYAWLLRQHQGDEPFY